VTATIPVNISPIGVAFDPHNNDIYVTNYDSYVVSVIGDSTNTGTATIPVGNNPYGIAFDPHNNDIYVANYGDNTVSVIATLTSADDTDPAVLGTIMVPNPIQVNTQFTASDTFTDDSDGTHTASWDWGDSTTSTGTVTESGGSGSVQDTHTYSTPGTYTITLTVHNSDGTTSSTQSQVVVSPADDTDPAVLGTIMAPVSPIQVNTQFTASDTFTDDSDDTHTASWDWGDSTTSTGTVTESGGSGSVQDTHTYSTPGVYTITLTVNNSDGTTATKQFQYVVAYDPNGAFVTGSGWINSPPGAYY